MKSQSILRVITSCHFFLLNFFIELFVGKNVSMRKSSLNSEAIMSLVENAEKIISDFAGPGAAPNDELSER